jgi:hypothetical protein
MVRTARPPARSTARRLGRGDRIFSLVVELKTDEFMSDHLFIAKALSRMNASFRHLYHPLENSELEDLLNKLRGASEKRRPILRLWLENRDGYTRR